MKETKATKPISTAKKTATAIALKSLFKLFTIRLKADAEITFGHSVDEILFASECMIPQNLSLVNKGGFCLFLLFLGEIKSEYLSAFTIE